MLQKIVTILFLSGDPLTVSMLAKILGSTQEEIEKHVQELETALSSIGLALLKSSEGLSIVTQASQASVVKAFWEEELKGELTPAAIQVLTLVAYLGEATREQISYIRGVQSAQSIRTLTVRGLIKRDGEICTLTDDSLKQLGVTKVENLPDYETINSSLKEKLDQREL
jgi:segregation and condensation protein B